MRLVLCYGTLLLLEDIFALRVQMTSFFFVPRIDVATPYNRAYMNKANSKQIRWKEDFFEKNYDTLLSIRITYDLKICFMLLPLMGAIFGL